jgi:hypothetical protein
MAESCVFQLTSDAVERRVTRMGPVVDAGRPPRCQDAEVTLAPKLTAWRRAGHSLSGLSSNGHRGNDGVVGCDATVVSESAGDGLGRLERRITTG